MTDLSAFPIATRWKPEHPDRIQLYSLPTPNGVKVSIALEELGLAYEPHLVDIMKNESWTPEFLSLNPNGKIPAIVDPDGPGGKPIGLFESGAILLYLAEKTGRLIPADAARRYETIQWVFFQMASIGPMFGQVGFFHSPDARSPTSARSTAMPTIEAPARRHGDAAHGPQMVHGRGIHDRRHRACRLRAIGSASTRRATSSATTISECRRWLKRVLERPAAGAG